MHYIDDGSHAWLVVPTRLVRRNVGLSRHISRNSYEDATKGLTYLEEDCDAPLFEERTGIRLRNVPVRDINDFEEFMQRHGLIPYRHQPRRRRAA